ncbi:MAG: hypothetical protein IT204_18985 [Fimbriimonadaceae bacterium]|nr:hypothetical protein [Fimbriimonadaceae bacterium]
MPTRYQTTTPYEALTDWLGRLTVTAPSSDTGEGLCWGGAASQGDFGGIGTTYPAFLALVRDDSGRLWPTGAASPVPIEFVDTSGTCGLYLVPFDDSVLPSYVSGQIGSFSLVAQGTAPADSLLLGSGTVADSAFSSFTEQSGVRRNSLAIGAGMDADLVLYARNGDANLPALRYQASGNCWQFSNDGTTWADLGAVALDADSGLEYNAGQLRVDVADGSLQLSSSGLSAKLDPVGGLELGAPGLAAKANGAKAIEKTSSGIGVVLASNPGLEFDGSNGVRVKLKSTGAALVRDSDGLSLDQAANLTLTGTVSIPSQVAQARLSGILTTNQTAVATGTYVAVDFTSASRTLVGFTWSAGSPTRFTVDTGYGGVYLVLGILAWDANATGRRIIAVWKNGTAVLTQSWLPVTGGSSTCILQTQWLGSLSAGDYLELTGRHDSGADRTYLANSNGAQVALTAVRLFGS